MREYKIISSLSDMSKVNENGNNFLRLINNTTHIPCLLQMPDYKPLSIVNNLGFISDDWVVVNERKLNIKTSEQMGHYHVNMAALLRLAEWFDYMRMNGVYDNSRIILVSDHGYGLRHFDDLVLDNSTGENIEWYYPLLLVKDFGSNKFVESEEFMTNAEVVNIALEGIINEPVNPFTGKRIVSKKDDIQYVFGSREHSLKKHGKNVYAPGVWYAVHTNIWNKNNWKVAKKDAVLPY